MNELIFIVGKYFIVIPPILALYVLIRLSGKNERLRFIVLIVGGGIVAMLIALLAGKLFYNPRPFVVGHFTPLIPHKGVNGFPSDHTLLASFIGFFLYRYNKKIAVATLILALLIGTARVLAGVHHPVDIIGSFVISFITVLVLSWGVERVKKVRS